ncbi:MAG: biotin synthase BioB [Burkholderiales bacterium]|jgi:biotin synthase|nr:biotin synthase BioB [Burkholderiales bacterium]
MRRALNDRHRSIATQDKRTHMPKAIQNICDAALAGRALLAEEALALIPLLPSHLSAIVAAAGLTLGPERFTCGIINAKSGRCTENCAFCAQSRHHETHTPAYPLVSEEVLLRRANALAKCGIKRMGIVTAGVGLGKKDFELVCAAARRIRREVGIELCASLGALTTEKARGLREAGFGSYHHNLETARSFYPSVCSTQDYEARCNTVLCAKEAGMRVCSGALFGLGESFAQRVELSQTLQELQVDSIPVNFLMPIPGTPLESARPLNAAEGLSILALLRLMHPRRDIVLCGGRTTTLGAWDSLGLFSCANGVMVGDYLTEKGGALERDMALVRDLVGFRRGADVAE